MRQVRHEKREEVFPCIIYNSGILLYLIFRDVKYYLKYHLSIKIIVVVYFGQSIGKLRYCENRLLIYAKSNYITLLTLLVNVSKIKFRNIV